jgi:hypothetical protein
LTTLLWWSSVTIGRPSQPAAQSCTKLSLAVQFVPQTTNQ